jgi:chromosome segregation ATPase
VEFAEKQLREYSQNLNKMSQEKFYLSEQQKNLNQDSPFAEEYRNDSMALKMKQTAIQQLKADLEKLETQINSTRTQLEIIKHEVEVGKADEADYIKENARLEKLLEIKKNNLPNGSFTNSNTSPLSSSNSAQFSNVQSETRTTTTMANNLINSNSITSINKFQSDNQPAFSNGFKNSMSLNNIRSATPKGKQVHLNFIIKKK